MKKTIAIKELIAKMRQVDKEGYPIPFSLKIRRFSNQNKTGGKYRIIPSAILCFRTEVEKPLNKENYYKLIHSMDRERRNPAHLKNFTINIELPEKRIEKINLLAIVDYNGMEVVL